MIGNLIVGIVMHMMGITPIDVLAHIRMIWEIEMVSHPKIRDATGEPIYGTVAGDEPPPPPQTKFAYYFQLNTKHCISLHRAVYLFNNLSNKLHHRIDRYLKHMLISRICPSGIQIALHVSSIRNPHAQGFLGSAYGVGNKQFTIDLRIMQHPSSGPYYTNV